MQLKMQKPSTSIGCAPFDQKRGDRAFGILIFPYFFIDIAIILGELSNINSVNISIEH